MVAATSLYCEVAFLFKCSFSSETGTDQSQITIECGFKLEELILHTLEDCRILFQRFQPWWYAGTIREVGKTFGKH